MSTLRRRLVGLGAVLLIAGIVIGLPIVLIAVGANPLDAAPSSLGDLLSALTSPDDGTLLMTIITVVAWLAWAFFTLALLLELAARVRGIHAPNLQGMSLPQNAARGLVGAAVMLFIALPSVTSASAATESGDAPTLRNQHVATAPVTSATTVPRDGTLAAQAVAEQVPEAQPATTKYTVKSGDSLWSIAETQLGDGHRFGEIVDLNAKMLGGKASFIQAGWELDIPDPVPVVVDTQEVTVTVDPGDTLSAIARDTLGDANRYPEIVEASKDTVQPGDAHLNDPNFILPGWTVSLPDSEQASEGSAATEAPSLATQDASTAPAAPPAPPAPIQEEPAPTPEVSSSTDREELGGGQTNSSAGVTDAGEDDLGDLAAWQVATVAGIGTVMAAGVLGVVARRRRSQQRLRRPGQDMPAPSGATALFEQEIRAAADPLSVETVDTALRSLARYCAEEGESLPVVRAARLTADRFELYLEESALLPAPWIDAADGKIWTLEVDAAEQLAPIAPRTITAPYPSLVTIGHDDEAGHVFLNLEHLGALGIIGDETGTREILAALAIELATSVWADDLQVTLVGAFPELEDALQTGRIRYLPTIDRIVDELTARATLDRQALAGAGAADLYSARVTGAVPDAWDPEIVLLAGSITEVQRSRLGCLIAELPHVAFATITSGVSIGEWALETVPDTDQAVLSPIGLQIHPQRVPTEQYGHLLQIVSMADVDELEETESTDPTIAEVERVIPLDEPASAASPMRAISLNKVGVSPFAETAIEPELTLSEAVTDEVGANELAVDEGPVEQPGDVVPVISEPEDTDEEGDASATFDHSEVTNGPRILVLGPVGIENTMGSVETSKRARLQEYATYLALNPGATHPAIDDAIWPDRKTEDNLNTRNTATSKLRRWMGQDNEGNDFLPRHQAGSGYVFHPTVTTDAAEWEDLLGGDPLNAPTENLEAALRLVRGIPFEGTHRRRYAWAEPIKQRLISEIVDTSYALSKRRLMEGRWRAAEEAVVVGLQIEPAQENLWRIRILAAHESRNPSLEAEAIERLLTITEKLECELEPETEQLLAALKSPGSDFDRLMAHAL